MEISLSLDTYLWLCKNHATDTGCTLHYPVDIWDSIFPGKYDLGHGLLDIIFKDNRAYVRVGFTYPQDILINDEAQMKIRKYERGKKIDTLLNDEDR